MIMNFLDTLEMIERKYGFVGTIIGILLILLIIALGVISINAILHVCFKSTQVILIKFFDIRLY